MPRSRADSGSPSTVGVGEHRDDVARRVPAAGGDDALDVVEDPLADRAAERQQAVRVGVDGVDHGGRVVGVGVVDDLVGPIEEPLGVVVGDPEDAGEHADRQRPGDVLDGVELGPIERVVEHGLDEPRWPSRRTSRPSPSRTAG